MQSPYQLETDSKFFIFAGNNLVSRMRSPRHPFVKIKPVDCRRSFLSRSSHLITDTLFVKIKPIDCRHPFIKIKLVDRIHSFSQDQASWSQTLLFVKIKPVDCRHLLSSRPSQLVTNISFHQDQAS